MALNDGGAQKVFVPSRMRRNRFYRELITVIFIFFFGLPYNSYIFWDSTGIIIF